MTKLSKIVDDLLRPIERILESKAIKIPVLFILLVFLAMAIYFMYAKLFYN